MNIKTISCIILFFPIILLSQNKSGYYINWNMNHAGTSITPSIPISIEEAKTINCYYLQFDGNNRLINVKFFFSGKPSNYSNYGAYELVREYYNGFFTEKFKNIKGKFVVNSSNIFKKKYYLNSEGYWTKKENYSNGQLVSEGKAITLVTRNKRNEIASEIQLSAKGDTIPDGNGFKIVHFSYNKDGLTTLRQNKNSKGTIVNGNQGYATVIFQFDNNGMFFEEEFRDENNNLFLHPRFDLAKINWREFNKYGKPSRIYYMNDLGYPHEKRAYAIIAYRNNMTRESITYYDRLGKKTIDRNGISKSIYNYDTNGKYLGKSNFNLDNKPIE